MNNVTERDESFLDKYLNTFEGKNLGNIFSANKTIKDLDLFPENWNNITQKIEEIPLNADFAWLLGLLLIFMVWATYYVYYNSRLLAFIATVIINTVIIPRYFVEELDNDFDSCCNCKCNDSGQKNGSIHQNDGDKSNSSKVNGGGKCYSPPPFSKFRQGQKKIRQVPYCSIGSLSISFISGKVMFREFTWIQPDYTLRILDGFVIFRWWVPYEPKDVRKIDCSHMDTRLFALLNGFELHIYNRSHLYHRLETVFKLPSKLFPSHKASSFANCNCTCHNEHGNGHEEGDDGLDDNVTTDLLNRKNTGTTSPSCECKGNRINSKKHPKNNDELITAYLWRDLIPVTKLEISTGRFVFGNSSMPTIISFAFDEANTTYTSKPSASPYDLFTHIAKSKVHRFKIILIPSPKYLGLTDEPPRYMGEGFVLIQCKSVEFHYYQDEPGFVSLEPEKLELLDGEIVERITHPTWGMDVKCEKSCTFSYGPWSDRQREFLYNFFYPLDYQEPEKATAPKLGQLRQFELFEFKINLLANSMIDILFLRENKETNVLHIGTGPGSCMEIRVPWVANDSGYTSHIKGSILHLDAKTCLNYRPLAESETFEFDLKINYPNVWNGHQEWLLNLTASKATVNLIFAHKIFFCDLIDDWSSKMRSDILKFVPYTWKINLTLKEFELITLANEGNWIDCSLKQYTANTQLAITGEDFELSFDLPFVEYLPVTVPIKLWIQGQSLEAAIHVPKTNPNREIIESLAASSKLCHMDDSKKFLKSHELFPKIDKWHRFTSAENGWVTCWSVPIVAISITYTYHPSPPMPEQSTFFGPFSNVRRSSFTANSMGNINTVSSGNKVINITDLASEESQLLQPLKPETPAAAAKRSNPPVDFYPGSLDSDKLELEIEIGPSNITLYGIILKMLWDLKENYVGECRTFTDITEKPQASKIRRLPFSKTTPVTFIDAATRIDRRPFDPRLFRPFEVKVSLAMHDIHAHLMKPCSENDPVCPFLYFERLSFEMDKKYTETVMQLLLSPVVVNSSDLVVRPESFKYLTEGFLVMSSLQFRGHAMFSEIGRPLDSDTLEYAWLIDVQVGEISGRLTLHQLSHVVSSIDCMAGGILLKDSVQPPPPPVKCLHDAIQASCSDTDSGANKICPNPEDIKYRVVRAALSSIDISLAELHTLTNLNVVPFKLSMCNVHGCRLNSGITGLIDKICIKQFLLKETSFDSGVKHAIHGTIFNHVEGNWTEVFSLSFGPIFLDTATEPPLATASYATNQEAFLRLHDERLKKLWFLWRRCTQPNLKYEKCGCIGGCSFFRGHLASNIFTEARKAYEKKSSRNRLSALPEGVKFGESILHPGDAMIGFSHNRAESRAETTLADDANATECGDDDDEVTLRGSAVPPVLGKTSPSMEQFLRRSSEEGLVYPIKLAASHLKAQKISFVSRQLSSPARSSPFTLTTPLTETRSNISSKAVSLTSVQSPSESGPYSDAHSNFPSSLGLSLAQSAAGHLSPLSNDASSHYASVKSSVMSSATSIPKSAYSYPSEVSLGPYDFKSMDISSDMNAIPKDSFSSPDTITSSTSWSDARSHIRTKSLDSQSTLTEKYFSADEGESSDSGTLKTASSHLRPTISVVSEDRSLFSALDSSFHEDPYDRYLFTLNDDSVSSALREEQKQKYTPGRVFDELIENDEFIRSDKTKILLRIDGTTAIALSPISSGGLRTMTETISDIVSLIQLNHLKMNREDSATTPLTPGTVSTSGPTATSGAAGATGTSGTSSGNKRSSGPSSGEVAIEMDRSTISLRQSPAPNIRSISQPIFYPNVIFGKFKLEKVTLNAQFSGLRLDGNLKMFSVTLIHNQKVRSGREKWIESSVKAELLSTKLTLFEEAASGQAINSQMIVKASLGKTNAHVTSNIRQGKETNSAHLMIGPILLDIPQQPSALHGMVTRSSRQISTTIQELRSSRQPSRGAPDVQSSSSTTVEATIIQIEDTSVEATSSLTGHTGQGPSSTPLCEAPVKMDPHHLTPTAGGVSNVPTTLLGSSLRKSALKPSAFRSPNIMVMSGKNFVVQFSISLESFTIGANLLPSLRAQYQIAKFSSSGITGDKARYVIDLMEHSLSFNVIRISGQQQQQQQQVPDGPSLPSFAKVALPSIHVAGEYLEVTSKERFGHGPDSFTETVVLRNSSYMNANVDIGFFEHSLTTDLLNQLIIIQKEFVKEINDVVLKMSGGDIIVIPTAPANSEGGRRSLLRISQGKSDLFKLKVQMKGIQITATTPTNSAVRLSAGPLDLSMSNLSDKHSYSMDDESATRFKVKLAIKIEVDLNVACKAEYHIPEIVSSGITGTKANFVIDVAEHQLSFDTNMNNPDNSVCLPSSTKVALPRIHVSGEYCEDQVASNSFKVTSDDGVVLRNGGYLDAFADIEFFEHSLTTDLLNHLILVQKEFMKEVNLVLQKMSGGDLNVIPIPSAQQSPPVTTNINVTGASGGTTSGSSGENSPSISQLRNQGRLVLFSLHLSFKGAQITATTPTNNAVRLETGEVSFQLSNRVQSMKKLVPGQTMTQLPANLRLFFRLQFDFSVALGQIIRNPVYPDEALPEFQPVAYFKTRVIVRNALQDELINLDTTSKTGECSNTDEVEAILVTLSRPLIYIQPLALDKAVLVWLNYKNAYEYWNEQRASVNPTNNSKNTSPDLTPNVPQVHHQIQQLSGQSLGTFLLQLTFDDLGICLPIAQITQQNSALSSRINYDAELKSALVVTLESTTISASSHGSLVSKGKFNGLCFRFADDFETSLDDWKPDPSDSSIMNIGVVSEGTYEICSRTATTASLTSAAASSSGTPGSQVGAIKGEQLASEAKWFLNVSWRMEGFDIHVDTSIGKQLSALFSTLTALAGDEDVEAVDQSYNSMNGIDVIDLDRISEPGVSMANDSHLDTDLGPSEIMRSKSVGKADGLEPDRRRISLVKDASFDSKKRSRLIERELNEQAKIINELRQEGASQSQLESEIKKLQDLEFAIFNDFRRDVMKKLRRHSTKPSREMSKRYDRSNLMRYPTMISPEKQESEFESVLGHIPRTALSSVDSEVDTASPTTGDVSILDREVSSTVDSVFDGTSCNLSCDARSSDVASIRSSSTATTATTVIPAYHGPSSRSSMLTKQMSMIAPSVSKTPSTESGSGGSDPYLERCGLSSASSPDDSQCMDTTVVSKPVAATDAPVTKARENEPSRKGPVTKIKSAISDSSLADSSGNSSDSDDSSGSDAPVASTNPVTKEVPTSTKYGHQRRASAGGSTASSLGHGAQRYAGHGYSTVQEPNIDFELEVMVYFNSGKCVFHTREEKKDDESSASTTPQSRKATLVPPASTSSASGLVKERSFAGLLDVTSQANAATSTSIPSPKNMHPRYQVRSLSGSIQKNTFSSHLLKNTSHSRLRPSGHATTQHATEYTMFLIPGLDVKVHYNSKNVLVEVPATFSASSTLTTASASSTRVPGSVIGISKDLEFHSSNTSVPKKQVTKKASCSAWITLHCIPEETVITPHILDFLEQALEPIPIESSASSTKSASSPSADAPAVDPESQGDIISSAPAQYAVYGSFPVDVIVYIHVQPSVLRFSCLPVSRVECLLQLPSVDLTFQSKRDEDEVYPTSSPTSAYEKSKSLPARVMYPSKWAGHRRVGSDYRYCYPQSGSGNNSAGPGSGGTSHQQLESCVAGMSMTGCLADFSLYIFHPYGGQKKSNIAMPSSLSSHDSTSSSKPFSGRKDSLSLQVEFVKINISRSRKLIFIMETSSPKMSAGHERSCQSAIIRFNGKCDVGSASFKYDMRRLTEILAFPKAWYRKAIWKRMFLGEESIASQAGFNESDDDFASSSVESLDHFGSSGGDSDQPSGGPNTVPPSNSTAPTSPNKENLWLNLNDPHGNRRNRDGTDWRQFSTGTATNGQQRLINTPWETYVVFTLELSKLNIMMNMGNVMGNTTWLSRGFKSEGRFSIDSSGHKGYIVKLGLDASSLDAKGGIVGGIIELSNIETEFNVKEDRGKEPSHALKLKLHTLQMRLDYMGTSILMLRISDLDLTLRDEWTIDQSHHGSKGYHPTKRPALIFIHSHLAWNQLQILMSKSTTPDIIKICSKLEEFFTQQFHSSVRVFSSLESNSTSGASTSTSSPAGKSFTRGSSIKSKSMTTGAASGRRNLPPASSTNSSGISSSSGHFLTSTPSSSFTNPPNDSFTSPPSLGASNTGASNEQMSAAANIEARHHRHWQKALKLVSGVTLSTLPNPLPPHGTVLGGTVELTGKNISLACFYGINFRSKAWAIFSLKQPTISFATEAQEVLNEVEGNDTHIIQNLSVSLGRGPTFSDTSDPAVTTRHAPMATVCRMCRSVQFPPQFRKMHEWFAYTFASSELDEVNRFPLVEFERATGNIEAGIDSLSGSTLGGGEIKRRISSASPKSHDNKEYHHNKEVIFALPSFQMELKTEHLQAPRTPTTAQTKPSVDCTFVTDFDDHIFVAVDAEAYFFLHELITSYIRERETPYNKASSHSPIIERSRKFTSASHKEDSTENTSATDWRDFVCHTWHLEPTVRLLSWAGKNIEPYGVDYILQRLGFTQARTTIPKWIQRGAMDPLDKILSLVMYQIIHANRIEQKS